MVFMSVERVYTTSSDAKAQWRVHVAAAGFGELNRIIEPLKVLPTDAFYLLQHPRGDRSEKWYTDKGVNVLNEVKNLGIREVGIWQTNLWSAADVGNYLGRKLMEHGFSGIDVNASCGPKTVGIGATLASLFWPIHLYYADVDYDDPEKPGPDDPWGPRFRSIQPIPTFHTEPPRAEVLQALTIISKQNLSISSAEFKNLLKEGHTPIIRPSTRSKASELSPQAVHGQFQNILRPLLEQRLITEQMQYGHRTFSITPQGRATLQLLGSPAESDNPKSFNNKPPN